MVSLRAARSGAQILLSLTRQFYFYCTSMLSSVGALAMSDQPMFVVLMLMLWSQRRAILMAGRSRRVLPTCNGGYIRFPIIMQSNLTTFYYPLAASGEMVGILNTMQDEMNTDLTDTTAADKSAIAAFDGLVKAKTKCLHKRYRIKHWT